MSYNYHILFKKKNHTFLWLTLQPEVVKYQGLLVLFPKLKNFGYKDMNFRISQFCKLNSWI